MRFIIQRVNFAEIKCFDIDNKLISENKIGKGLLIFVGISRQDIDNLDILEIKDLPQFTKNNKQLIDKIKKILCLPLFDNEEGKIKLSIKDISGEILLVPNFTLYGRNKKGCNIDYTNSGKFKESKVLFEIIYNIIKSEIPTIKGIFGSYMKINTEIDGPVNFIYEI